MASTNFQKKLDSILETLVQSSNPKPKLLLHACCGPCSSYVLEYLSQYFNITVYFFNPNIYPQQEHDRRLEELVSLYKKFPPVINNNIQLVQESYNPHLFYEYLDLPNHPDFITEPEKGNRCYSCYELRLKKTFEYAKANHFDYFCTTLSISPFKDANKINSIGFQLEEKYSSSFPDSPKWLFSDFKKKGGFQRSLEISTEYNLYRQQYCGCVYSLQNTKQSHSQ